jgi:hypothetical protein
MVNITRRAASESRLLKADRSANLQSGSPPAINVLSPAFGRLVGDFLQRLLVHVFLA